MALGRKREGFSDPKTLELQEKEKEKRRNLTEIKKEDKEVERHANNRKEKSWKLKAVKDMQASVLLVCVIFSSGLKHCFSARGETQL